MDRLKHKDYDVKNIYSRYISSPSYYNILDNKYIRGISSHLSKSTAYTLHKMRPYDTLDNLALMYYGRPDLFWVIADFNNVHDPFIDLAKEFKKIKIPNLFAIKFEGRN
ncbi:MAG TPA: hypothetical protein GX745_08235 [Clostridiales bacterium]|nr:hypothetical protein [Clostridiales bacterium]